MIRRLLHWLSFRHARRNPGLLLLSLAGMALGVAVFVAIQIANRTVLRTFQATVDAIAGRATLEIAAGPGGLPDSLFAAVRRLPEVAAATPLVTAHALLPGHPGEVVEVVGVDPLSNRPFTAARAPEDSAGGSSLLRLLAEPRAALVPERMARDLGLTVGDRLPILIRSAPDTVTIVELLHFAGAVEHTAERILVLDIAAAQEVTGKPGRLDRIDLVAPDPEAALAAVQALADLPADAQVRRPGARTAQIETLLAAFRLNLTALSLIALFVGTFLVYNAALTSVVRRRQEIGILMALGMSRRTVQSLVLIEQLILGALGIAAGCGLGILLARGMLGAIAHTVSALYVRVFVRELFVEPKVLGLAVVAGMGAVLAAAWFPAREATALPPQTVLTEGRRPSTAGIRSGWWFVAGAVAWGLALMVARSAFSAAHPPAGFLSALLLLGGGSLMAPAVARGLLWLSAPAVERWPSLRLAAGELRVGLRRAAVAIAALGSALAMVIAISIMITSFRRTVDLWIEQTVRADLYVSPASLEVAGSSAALDPEVIAAAIRLPGVRAVDRLHRVEGLTLGGRAVRASAILFDVIARESRFWFLAVDPTLASRKPTSTEVLQAAARAGAVVVSEPLARRHQLTAGDTLRLATPTGPRGFRIAGVFRDYSSDAGLILFDLPTYTRAFQDSTVNSLALYLRDPATGPALRQELLASVGGRHALIVRSNRDLRQAALTEFDRTFAVTMTLKLITVIVAIAGVFFTLTVGVAERRAEIGVLRALGASSGQVRRMVLGEALLIGLSALAIGAVTGVALALLLVFVVNPQFFGWTILWVLSPRVLLEAVAVVGGAALLAAWWPARSATRGDPARSLRSE